VRSDKKGWEEELEQQLVEGYQWCLDDADLKYRESIDEAEAAYRAVENSAGSDRARAKEAAEDVYREACDRAAAQNEAGVAYCQRQFGPQGTQAVADCLGHIRDAFDRALDKARDVKASAEAAADMIFEEALAEAEQTRTDHTKRAEEEREEAKALCGPVWGQG